MNCVLFAKMDQVFTPSSTYATTPVKQEAYPGKFTVYSFATLAIKC